MKRTKKLKFYADWSLLKKVWSGLFERPRGSIKNALKLNKVKLDPKILIYDGKGLSLVIDNENAFEEHSQKIREEFNNNLPNGFRRTEII